jgi:hypothetical protein
MRYKVQTILLSQVALEQAQTYFGPKGQGLTMTSQHKRALRWEGGGGHVSIMVKSDTPTLLEIETREWDEAVRQFIAQLPQKRSWWRRWWQRLTGSNAQPTGHPKGAGSQKPSTMTP